MRALKKRRDMLPALYEGETLYSLLTATQRLRADSRAEVTCATLFGSPVAGLRHDFPSHLDEFSRRTRGVFGTPEVLAMQHSVLPYFTAFRNQDVVDRAIIAMAGNTVNRLKFILGLPASPAGANYPLSFCKTCTDVDINRDGRAHWHRIHQLPASYLCPIHHELLLTSEVRLNGLGRSQLFFPGDQDLNVRATALELTPDALPILRRFSALSAATLTKSLPGGFNEASLQACYRFGLSQLGLLTPAGFIRANDFVSAVTAHFRPISSLSPFHRVVSTSCSSSLLRLIRKPRNGIPTLTHLLLIEFLFGDWERFVSAYRWESQLSFSFNRTDLLTSRDDELPPTDLASALNRIADGYRTKQGSLRALCTAEGVDINTAMRWIGRLGLADISRRPRVVTNTVRRLVVSLLEAGHPLRDVCAQTSLSKSTVDRILNDNSTLRATWKASALERRRKIERDRLDDFLALNPEATMPVVRATTGIGYSWLLRHDRLWLRSRVRKSVRTGMAEHKRVPRVDWSGRDAQCLAALQIVAESLELSANETLKAPAILRRLPKLPFKPRLERLPESRKYIESLLDDLRDLRAAN